MKALIVDDSRAIRLVLRKMLSGLGLDVSEAGHGQEALEFLQAHADIDVALIDWNMPEMNGLELVEAVRKDARLNSLRMMMVTTETEVAHVQRALLAGASEYVMKPFSQEMIQEKLLLLGVSGDGLHSA